MRCESCGTENPTGQRFCGHCGAALTLICGSCGATNQPSQKYCGASLTEAREIFERLGARPWLERLQRVDEREGATS